MDNKQIEEMAREIAKRDCYLYEKCPKPIKHNCVSQDPAIMMESSKNYITIATWLVRAGYRKERQGEWRETCIMNIFQCTNCNKSVSFDEFCNGVFTSKAYCPNCGAHMKGE